MSRGFDREMLRNCAVMLDTEAENLTDRMSMLFRSTVRPTSETRKLSERRSKLWHIANLLRDVAE